MGCEIFALGTIISIVFFILMLFMEQDNRKLRENVERLENKLKELKGAKEQ